MRDYIKCSGCRRCKIACSLRHEERIWPEASRIRVFMLFPGLEVPHFCTQCEDAPYVDSCPVDALEVDIDMKSIVVDREKCTSCGNCIDACPGKAPMESFVDDEIKEYYQERGWDERGIPTSQELKRLGLESVDKKLEEIR